MTWFPFLWGTHLTRNCLEPRRESYCWHWPRDGSGALSPWLIPLETCECTEMHRAPVPGSRARRGAPGELPWSSFQTLRSTTPRRPLPASSTGLEQGQSWERRAAEPGTHPGCFTFWPFLLFFSPRLFLSSFFSLLVGIPSPLPRPPFSFFSFGLHFPGGSLQTFPSHSGIR